MNIKLQSYGGLCEILHLTLYECNKSSIIQVAKAAVQRVVYKERMLSSEENYDARTKHNS